MFLLSQVLVTVAVLLDLASFQFMKRQQVLLALSLSTALTAIHFYLLDATAGALLMAVASLRYLVFIKSQSKRLLIGFLLLNTVPPLVHLNANYELYAVFGSVLLTLGAFIREQVVFRCVMMLGTVCWLIHNCYIGSPMAIVLESTFLVSNLIGLGRIYMKRKTSKLKAE
ncbi:hypothetical protein CBQ28_04265 [Pseudoalteromonas sp. GCY]|uniref:YgjV family protein n=1 Tax=Pseudoalteromonas sp. GCY TaxID=2003316 RepID=UPI000BFED22F|nr:YgjV family protein [Pseudoalteromonas sp. GCY]PHI38304.1 hypothetical protein CBQ28_04265 [Pseudoalteromonas sp. GCY]QQQ65618.1 YgjV family protein [Pseudoalteromonas sp. GCY]